MRSPTPAFLLAATLTACGPPTGSSEHRDFGISTTPRQPRPPLPPVDTTTAR